MVQTRKVNFFFNYQVSKLHIYTDLETF